jgi:putative transposase
VLLDQRWQETKSTTYDERPRFLIRDNDSKYGAAFNWVADSTLIDVLRTPSQAPKANAICERFIGSVRRECLDHILIISERQLYRLVKEYVEYFNHARPHQGIGSQIPQPRLADDRGAQEG